MPGHFAGFDAEFMAQDVEILDLFIAGQELVGPLHRACHALLTSSALLAVIGVDGDDGDEERLAIAQHDDRETTGSRLM